MEKEALFKKIDRNADAIRSYRPLSEDEIKELDAYFKIGVTYSSNALEGNSLTLSETKVLLEDGITVGGKPIRDCYEATGHAKAYDFMLELARITDFTFTEKGVKRLHYLFYNGIDPEKAGQYRKGQVFIAGTEYVPPTADEVPRLTAAFIDDLNAKKGVLHPVELAAYAHRRLVDIHPFQDGNGRTARLLMNLILVNKGYCIVSIPPILRHDYITALQQAQRSNSPSDIALIQLIAECEIEAQKDYCRMFHIKLPDLPRDTLEK
ncbi:MAG: Fic family protein [Bacillota bacterium]|nr:Fic family protein [Bacillota bacterium]